MEIPVEVWKMIIYTLEAFALSIISLLFTFSAVPRFMKFPLYDLLRKDEKSAGYYYVFTGLIAGGIIMLSMTLARASPIIAYFPEYGLMGEIAIATALAFVGLIIGIVVSLVTLWIVDKITPVKEWELIRGGSDSAGLYFIGVGVVVFSILSAIGILSI